MDLEVFGLVSPHLVCATLDKGAVLYEPGDLVETIYFPDDAVLCLMTLLQSGEAIESAVVGREGAIGLGTATAPRRAISRTLVQAGGQVWRAPAEPLRSVWMRAPSARDLGGRHTEAVFAQMAQSVACNALHSVEARFARWLLVRRDRVDTRVLTLTQEAAADNLGVQRTTVTVVARAMQSAGLIRYSRGMVEILDRAGLEGRACECYGAVRRAYERLLPGAFD